MNLECLQTYAMWETWVWSLGWEDPLEKGKATHSSILSWRIPWTIVQGVAKSQTQLSDFHVCVCVCVILFLMIMLSYAINVLWNRIHWYPLCECIYNIQKYFIYHNFILVLILMLKSLNLIHVCHFNPVIHSSHKMYPKTLRIDYWM